MKIVTNIKQTKGMRNARWIIVDDGKHKMCCTVGFLKRMIKLQQRGYFDKLKASATDKELIDAYCQVITTKV